MKTHQKPMIWKPKLQIMRSPLTKVGYGQGEGGPETRFFLIALHKLARALQITLTWWGGLGQIGERFFNTEPTRPIE